MLEMFACGQSPLCSEVNRLVQAGVVVVTAAGDTPGMVRSTPWRGVTKVGLSNTINDPGNAELAITVGATHREAPHTYGAFLLLVKRADGGDEAAWRARSCRAGRARDLLRGGCEAGKGEERRKLRLRMTSRRRLQYRPMESLTIGRYRNEHGGAGMSLGAIAAFSQSAASLWSPPRGQKDLPFERDPAGTRALFREGHGLLEPDEGEVESV